MVTNRNSRYCVASLQIATALLVFLISNSAHAENLKCSAYPYPGFFSPSTVESAILPHLPTTGSCSGAYGVPMNWRLVSLSGCSYTFHKFRTDTDETCYGAGAPIYATGGSQVGTCPDFQTPDPVTGTCEPVTCGPASDPQPNGTCQPKCPQGESSTYQDVIGEPPKTMASNGCHVQTTCTPDNDGGVATTQTCTSINTGDWSDPTETGGGDTGGGDTGGGDTGGGDTGGGDTGGGDTGGGDTGGGDTGGGDTGGGDTGGGDSGDGEGSGSAGLSCTNYSCSGDAILCSIQRASWEQRCANQWAEKANDLSADYENALHQMNNPQPFATETDGSSLLNVQNHLGASSGSCLPDISITFAGRDFSLSLGFLCAYLSIIALVIKTLAWLLVGRMIMQAL